jgi:hypothetical protein
VDVVVDVVVVVSFDLDLDLVRPERSAAAGGA